MLGVPHCLDGGLVVGEYGTFPGLHALSSSMCSARASPLSYAAYTVEVADVPMYWVCLMQMPSLWSVDVTAAAPTWPLIPLPSVYMRIVPGSVASCSLIAPSADSLMRMTGGDHHGGTTCGSVVGYTV